MPAAIRNSPSLKSPSHSQKSRLQSPRRVATKRNKSGWWNPERLAIPSLEDAVRMTAPLLQASGSRKSELEVEE